MKLRRHKGALGPINLNCNSVKHERCDKGPGAWIAYL